MPGSSETGYNSGWGIACSNVRGNMVMFFPDATGIPVLKPCIALSGGQPVNSRDNFICCKLFEK